MSSKKKIATNFTKKLIKRQKKIYPEFAKILDDCFWELANCHREKKMSIPSKFKITKEHILLAKNMIISWWDCEYGAPCIDPKRPYGNGDVRGDICRILGKKMIKIDDEEDGYKEKDLEYAAKIHEEMKIALQIFLCTKSFKIGTYEMKDRYNCNSWRLVK